jgi:hypothetical protein
VLNERDKKIIESLQDFKMLDRDQLIELHFGDVKDSVSSCNKVLKRLQRDGHIDCDTSRRPFHYFPIPTVVKKDSQKAFHFKAIADVVIEAKKAGNLTVYEVEPKLGEKGTVEPDLFMCWNKIPLFVEVQRTFNSKKYMTDKIEKYQEYYESEKWKELHWQQPNKKYFPYILVITNNNYDVEFGSLKVFQTKNFEEFIQKHCKQKEESK